MTGPGSEGLLQRTFQRVLNQWRDIAASPFSDGQEALSPDLPDADADRVAVLKDGTCHQIGTPTEILESPATEFVETFLARQRSAT